MGDNDDDEMDECLLHKNHGISNIYQVSER